MLSHRGAAGAPGDHLAFAGWHEGEDVLVATGWAELLPLEIHGHQPAMRLRRLAGRSLRRLAGPTALVPPGRPIDPVLDRRRSRPVDHVLFMGQTPYDLPLVERLRLVRRRTGVLSVWLPEVWPTVLDDPKLWREPFSMVDHLFVGHPAAIDGFTRVAPRAQVHLLPVAVDAVRFAAPVPGAPEPGAANPGAPDPGAPDPQAGRPIDVLGIGRRHPDQHRLLLDWATRRHRLYLYDTLTPRAPSWAEHRSAIANWYQHTSVALCNYAKHDEPDLTGPLRAVPMRLFEGLAAGAVLLGMPPDEDEQRQLVGRVVVEPLTDEAGRLNPVLDADPADPAITALRAANMALAARRHDWGHRWRTMLEALGLPVPPALDQRLDRLRQRADALEALAAVRS